MTNRTPVGTYFNTPLMNDAIFSKLNGTILARGYVIECLDNGHDVLPNPWLIEMRDEILEERIKNGIKSRSWKSIKMINDPRAEGGKIKEDGGDDAI